MKNLSPHTTILVQSIVFSIPQSLLLFVYPFMDGIIYMVFCSIIAIGIINGFIVYKIESIFPSVIAASSVNIIMTIFFIIPFIVKFTNITGICT